MVMRVRIGDPLVGYYKVRKVKGGPWLPASIFYAPPNDPVTGEVLDRPRVLQGEVDGKPTDLHRLWESCAGHRISSIEYFRLKEARKHAVEHRPDLPEASPNDPIDLTKAKPLF